MSTREKLEHRLQMMPGLVRRRSRYGSPSAYHVADREIVHFHGDGRTDVRLTSAQIAEMKAEGALDVRMRTRGPAAHWAAVSIAEPRDTALAIQSVEEAVRANA